MGKKEYIYTPDDSEEKVGEHTISVCTGTACFIRGSSELLETIENKLKTKLGSTTEDGKITVDSIRCAGRCGFAPIVKVDGQVRERVTKQEIESVIRQLKK